MMKVLTNAIPTPATKFSDGKNPVSLDSYRGKYILANFWATWCSPCIREMPALDRLAANLETRNLMVVAISQDEGGPAQVKPFIEKLKLNKIRILYDTDKRAFRDFALRGLPTTVLISPEGKLLSRLEGGAAWDEGSLAAQVENLLGMHARR